MKPLSRPFTRTPPPGWARRWLRTPYRPGGRDPATGVDCWGLALAIWQAEFGWTGPDPFPAWRAEDFACHPEGFAAAARFSRVMLSDFARTTTPRLGDCVALRLGGDEAHAGIVIGGGRFIHCQEGVGTAIARLDSFAWRSRIGGFYAPL